jgi:L-ascorbate metabolism protein UlaG (beta-lactamase superfamily)
MADMKYVIGDYYKPDLAILPVAGVFMMDIDQAVYAAGELIKPKKAIPFGYFPDPEKAIDPAGMAAFLKAMTSIAPMTGDFAPAFRKALAKSYPEIDAVILEVGQKIDLR